MLGRSTQRIWAVMMIVSLTSTAVLSQSLSQCLGDLNEYLLSNSLPGMCTEENVQGKLVNDSNGHTCMCTCTRCMFMFPLYNAHTMQQYTYMYIIVT